MDTIELTRQFGRYGYRMITGMLNNAGWHVNHKRVERIWRRTRRQVPQKRAKRCRLWLNDLSCLRLRPKHPNQVWSYDFVQDRTHDGKTIRTRDGIDEFTKKALVIRAKRRLNSADVVDAFADLSILRGPTKIIGSDSGAEVIAEKLRILMGPAPLKSCWNGPAATGQPQRGDCRSRTNEGRSIAELPEYGRIERAKSWGQVHILITGATVKDGKTLIAVLVQDHPEARVTALCHDLLLPETATLRVVRGSLPDHETCRRALQDATLVVHLATRRETPDAACPA